MRMIRRYISFLAAVALTLGMCCAPVYGFYYDDPGYDDFGYDSYDYDDYGYDSYSAGSYDRVYDMYGLFSADERSSLDAMCRQYGADCGLDLIIVTAGSTGGKSDMEYADDFYDAHEFGYEGETGVLLLIDMGERQIWISTAGAAIDQFTEERIDSLVDEIAGELADGDYYEGCETFIQHSCRYFTTEVSAGEVRRARGVPLGMICVSLAAAMAIAAGVLYALYRSYVGTMTADHLTYLQENTLSVTRSGDRFLRTTMAVHRLDTANRSRPGGMGGGPGGGVHTSGGGSTHGGGGGSF